MSNHPIEHKNGRNSIETGLQRLWLTFYQIACDGRKSSFIGVTSHDTFQLFSQVPEAPIFKMDFYMTPFPNDDFPLLTVLKQNKTKIVLPSFAEKVMVHKRIIFLDVDVADLV